MLVRARTVARGLIEVIRVSGVINARGSNTEGSVEGTKSMLLLLSNTCNPTGPTIIQLAAATPNYHVFGGRHFDSNLRPRCCNDIT